MAYLTVPALIGPVIGPPLGGFIATYFSWRWIFCINIPIGVLGIVLRHRFIDELREEAVAAARLARASADRASAWPGCCSASRLSAAASCRLPAIVGAARDRRAVAARSMSATPRRVAASDHRSHAAAASRPSAPASIGGFLFRIGIGALPFLLPLMLQLGFGLTAFESGLLTFASAAGALIDSTQGNTRQPLAPSYGNGWRGY